jgi:hypothetical protein
LSFDVVAASDDASTVLEGRRRCPRVEFVRIISGQRLPLPTHRFDAAFVQPWLDDAESWLSLAARQRTAGVLALLKPEGRLHWWRRSATAVGHTEACWLHHVGCFPGRLETFEFAERYFDRRAWGWLLRREPPRRTRFITLQTPEEPLTPAEWRNYAQCGLLTNRRLCCDHAARAESTERRVA